MGRRYDDAMSGLVCLTCGRRIVDGASDPAQGARRRCPRCGATMVPDPVASADGQAQDPMRVALLGFGLIGGSIARALARPPILGAADPNAPSTAIRIVAWSPSGEGPRAAAADGLVEAAARSEEAIEGADLVVLAAPPLECLRLVDALAGPLRGALGDGATVTDVASTKRLIVRRAEALGLRFVGGHPMAGREQAGYGASDATLFAGRPWVVVPSATSGGADVARVERLATACGARPLRLGAAEHDAAVAGISHLPLVLAAALVETIASGPGAAGDARALAGTLAAGGWESATRLARGDPAMGAGILATNADEIARRLRAYRDVLDDWLATLETPEGPDAPVIERRLDADARALASFREDAPSRAARARLEAAGDA